MLMKNKLPVAGTLFMSYLSKGGLNKNSKAAFAITACLIKSTYPQTC